MSLYVDSSALVKRYLDEPGRDRLLEILAADPRWLTARLTLVEVRRTLARTLRGEELGLARASFARDWSVISVIDLDQDACEAAARIAELTGLKSLDALHLGAAERARTAWVTLLTADRRQADAARALGWAVLGA